MQIGISVLAWSAKKDLMQNSVESVDKEMKSIILTALNLTPKEINLY